MSVAKASAGPDRFKRHKTRHRGITYRVRSDGSRVYSVYIKGTYRQVVGGEHEALVLQGELRRKLGRGERFKPTKATFSEMAELWFESKRKLRPWTRKNYRNALDRILIPKLGSMKITAITADHVEVLIRELEADGLSGKTIENYLLPLSGTLAFAVRRGVLSLNPCSLLTRDERPQRRPPREKHVWSDEEIDALINASEELALQPEARYEYAPLLRTGLYTGLRFGRAARLAVGRHRPPRGRLVCPAAVDALERVRANKDRSRRAPHPVADRTRHVLPEAEAAYWRQHR